VIEGPQRSLGRLYHIAAPPDFRWSLPLERSCRDFSDSRRQRRNLLEFCKKPKAIRQ